MAFYPHGCPGNYDFDSVARFARKRLIEGYNAIDLMLSVSTYREKEEVALVTKLDLDDETVVDLEIDCKYASKCNLSNCKNLLKKIISEDLAQATT